MSKTLRFQIKEADWTLLFDDDVVSLLAAQRQTFFYSKEKVGQLFSRDLTGNEIVVDRATVLPAIHAKYAGVHFDPEVAYQERLHLFEQGWHCIGLWHSHPESRPSPSFMDLELAADYAAAARPHLSGIVFAIVGKAKFPHGLSVGVHDGAKFHQAAVVKGEARKRSEEY